MSATRPNNPQAYPQNSWHVMNPNGAGMSMRDVFANSAITGILSNPSLCAELGKIAKNNGVEMIDSIAEYAWLCADTMLKQRGL